MGFSRQEYWSELPCLPPGDLPNPEIEPRFPTFQADSLPSEPPRKPKNTGVGSLSLLQGIFLTQKSNQGFLYYRQILYHLSYQGSPIFINQFRLVTQSRLTLCDPMDYTVYEILQASVLEWVAVPFSRRSSQPRDRTQVSYIVGGFFTI